MKEETKEELLLKHYRNLHGLAKRQLAAVNEGNSVMTQELISQKEIIITEIKKWHVEFATAGCSGEAIREIRRLLAEIVASEDESRKILSEKEEGVRKAMLATRQSSMIQQAYGNQVYHQPLVARPSKR
jgi:hypothetical protein